MASKYTKEIINQKLNENENTKQFTLLSDYHNSHTKMQWRYMDEAGKPHYFKKSWANFRNGKKNFSKISFKNKDILQEAEDALGDEYTVLTIEIDNRKPSHKVYFLLRHNSAKCNYHVFWRNVIYILYYRRNCPECARIKLSEQRRMTKDEVARKVFSQPDNHHYKYVPDLSNYRNNQQRLNWCEYHENGHVSHFKMTLGNFYEGKRPDNKPSKNERYFKDVLDQKGLKENVDYFYSFKSCELSDDLHKKPYRSSLSFDYFFPKSKNDRNVAVELNGIQHVKPVKWCKTMTPDLVQRKFRYQKARDARKRRYCKAHHIDLVEIPCYVNGNSSDSAQERIHRVIDRYYAESVEPLI